MTQFVQHLTPQLRMRRRTLDGLPDIEVPPGYTIRTSQNGDGAHWARIIRESFADNSFDEARFERDMRGHPAYRPDRIFFACAPDGLPCATASAYREESFGPDVGVLHYVGVCPAHLGKRLGAIVSLMVLRKFRSEGVKSAVLQTDDFRLPAIKIYLALDFRPVIVDPNQPARWDAVRANLGLSISFDRG